MTTVFLDNKKDILAMDTRCTRTHGKKVSILGFTLKDNTYCTYEANFYKVFYRSRERMITGSGSVYLIKQAVGHILKGNTKQALKILGKESTIIDIQNNPKKRFVYGQGEKEDVSSFHFSAIGSGNKYAVGAYQVWNHIDDPDAAKKAIEMAREYDDATGGDVLTFDVSGRWWDEDVC